MIEVREDVGLQARDHAVDFEAAQREYRQMVADGKIVNGRVVPDEPAPDDEEAETETQAEILVPTETAPEPDDPGAHARHIRMGVVFGIFLVFLVLWIVQSRKAAGK